MAPRLSHAAHAAIEDLLVDDPEIDIKRLAYEFSTTLNTVQRIRKGLLIRRAIGADLRGREGRKRLITPPMEAFIKQLLQRDPSLYQDEISTYIDLQYGVKVDQPTISRCLKRLKITRKQLRIIAQQRNARLIREWRLKSMAWHADQLVFCDESSYNEKLGERRYGYSPIGSRAEMEKWLKGERVTHSLLPAYSTAGYISPIIFDGGSTMEIFEDWLDGSILPIMAESPSGMMDILVMDNASIHRNQRVPDLCLKWGIQLEYLPPYCPFLNPIEDSFHDLKAYIRRHYQVRDDGTYADFQSFFHHAVLQFCVGVDGVAAKARGHFKHAGYDVSEVS